LKGASAAQFGAVFGIIHLSLFLFGKFFLDDLLTIKVPIVYMLFIFTSYRRNSDSMANLGSAKPIK
jgi:hypothetical protein